MNDDRAFERATRAWLEDGSDQTSPATIDAVLLAVRTTPQERDLRIPWRTAPMSNPMRLAAAIAIVAVVGFAGLNLFGRGGIGSKPTPSPTINPTPSSIPTSGPSPAATPIDTATWTAFTSARHGYAARYPSAWALTLATAPATLKNLTDASLNWTSAQGSGGLGAIYDQLKAPTGDEVDEIVGVSLKLPAGMTEAQWIAGYRQPIVAQFGASCFPAPDQWQAITVDGHAGGLYLGCGFVESTTFVNGRAYVFSLTKGVGGPTPSMEALLRAFLTTVTINAAAADDTPVVSPAPS
jgi:hypothetical protein